MRIYISTVLFIFLSGICLNPVLAQTGEVGTAEPDSFYFGVFDEMQLGFGLTTFMGSMDGNPQNDPLHFTARVNPSLFATAYRFVGSGVSVGADLSYERLSGVRSRDTIGGERVIFRFSNNLLTANILATYQFDFVPRGYLKIYAGGGPTLLISPHYHFGGIAPDEVSDSFGEIRPDLGTRPIFSLTGGIILFDQLRIGYRLPLTQYVDGWQGFPGKDRVLPYDLIMYVQFGFTLRQLNDAFDVLSRL